MMKLTGLAFAAGLATLMGSTAMAEPVTATPGQQVNAVLLPKFLGILPFDQANRGAQEAAAELGSTGTLEFIGPTPENSAAGQIEMLTNATTQKQNVVMLSNNAGDQIAPAAEAAQAAGTKVVTWDSPIPNGAGESFFVAQVDFGSIGVVMADMAYDLAGGSGEFAVLSASPDAANQNAWIDMMKEALKGDKYKDLKLVDVVYGNDQSEESYNKALGLVDKYPDLKVIMAPTTVGIVAAAKAMQRPRLPDLPRLLCAGDRRHQGRGRRGVHRRPHGHLQDRRGPRPSGRQACADGTVHRLHQRKRRSRRQLRPSLLPGGCPCAAPFLILHRNAP